MTTRKEHAAQAPDCFWRIMGDEVEGLVAALIDDGQAGSADSFTATSKDGQTVTLISPFPLTDEEKATVREGVARRAKKRWLNKWATFITPEWFSEGLEPSDYTRAIV